MRKFLLTATAVAALLVLPSVKSSFAADETGDPSAEGTVTGYFPCDPAGSIQGTFRTGANCIQSLALTNPAASNPAITS